MTIKHEDVGPLVNFSSRWDIVGPFQIGTREASWGADPLECLGGFRNLEYDLGAKFHSSLAPDGRVSWSSQHLDNLSNGHYVAEATLTVSFPSIDWTFLQSVYGWAALQYQAWARGYMTIEAGFSQSILLYADNVLEFWVNDKHFFGGDFYAYRNTPLVLHLEPGRHKVDVRLIRDARAMGAIGDPEITIQLKAEGSDARLAIMPEKTLVSDVVNGTLAGPFASISLRNDSKDSINVLSIASQSGTVVTDMLEKSPVRLAPGQSRPLRFRILTKGLLPVSVTLEVTYILCEHPLSFLSIVIDHPFVTAEVHSPHKYTFQHSSGIISYAILRAPSKRACGQAGRKRDFPILISLHGAGLEADSDEIRHTLDAVPDLPSWVLFPSGVTPWSADDWHTWGFADVEAGATAIADWIETVGWEGPCVDKKRWLISGHSNGGQGAWFALTHRPDRVIGAAVVSGYSSIQRYVPYQMWNEVDPRITAAVQSSLQGFRHELLVQNFDGIPIIQQHGDADDNVPVDHSRRMSQRISWSNGTVSSTYMELEGKGHWFEGVMSTPPLREFYAGILSLPVGSPALPQTFSIVVANPADMGPRGGLVVDQLAIPDQVGKIDVSRDTSTWTMKTSNIRRFHIEPSSWAAIPPKIVIDQDCLDVPTGEAILNCWIVRSLSGQWQVSHDTDWLLTERHGAQLGPLDSILRSPGPFHIHPLSSEASEIALQISRNLFQYFAADTEIVEGVDDSKSARGNVISIAIGGDFPNTEHPHFPIDLIENEGIGVLKNGHSTRVFGFQEGLGAVFLRPLPNERLELVIWGLDELGLRLAARLLPMMTGVGQPAFTIVSKRCAWEGAGGVLAMGSFDSFWNLSDASFVS